MICNFLPGKDILILVGASDYSLNKASILSLLVNEDFGGKPEPGGQCIFAKTRIVKGSLVSWIILGYP